MEMFGPTRCRWEGGYEGEKGIQIVKHHFTAFRKGYLKQIHDKCNISQTVKNVKLYHQINIYTDKVESKKHVKYKNTIYFYSKLVRHHPLSLVCIQDDLSFVVGDL